MTDTGDQMTLMRLLGQRLVSREDGVAVVTSLPAQQYENYMGRMHGGYVAALIDSALGAAVGSKLPDGTGFGTIDLNVKFVRKIEVATGLLTATGTVEHAGRSMLTATARVVDAEGKLYAHGSGSFLVYPKQAS